MNRKTWLITGAGKSVARLRAAHFRVSRARSSPAFKAAVTAWFPSSSRRGGSS